MTLLGDWDMQPQGNLILPPNGFQPDVIHWEGGAYRFTKGTHSNPDTDVGYEHKYMHAAAQNN